MTGEKIEVALLRGLTDTGWRSRGPNLEPGPHPHRWAPRGQVSPRLSPKWRPGSTCQWGQSLCVLILFTVLDYWQFNIYKLMEIRSWGLLLLLGDIKIFIFFKLKRKKKEEEEKRSGWASQRSLKNPSFFKVQNWDWRFIFSIELHLI